MSTKINTKLEAYKLIHDPTKLLSLLYSKYGDIDEDFFILNTNQIIYNRLSHLNILYKEITYNNIDEEYLKRLYYYIESEERIPKLSEYYKNYHTYFCKPQLISYFFANLFHNYYNNKAEIFYKNNYSQSKNISSNNNNSKNSSLSSSFDNITDIRTIFNEKVKCILENKKTEKNSENYSLKLTLNSIKNESYFKFNDLITEKIQNNSITKIINYLDSNKTYNKAKASVNNNRNNNIALLENSKNKTVDNNIKKNNNLSKLNNLAQSSKKNTNNKIWKLKNLISNGNKIINMNKNKKIKKKYEILPNSSDNNSNNNNQNINFNTIKMMIPLSLSKKNYNGSKFNLVKASLNDFMKSPKNAKINLFNKYSINGNTYIKKNKNFSNFSENSSKFNIFPVYLSKKQISKSGISINNTKNYITKKMSIKHKKSASYSNNNDIMSDNHRRNSNNITHSIKKSRPCTAYKNIMIGAINSLVYNKHININNLKNILCVSRNKKNILHNYATHTWTQSLSQSESRSLDKRNGSCDNKTIYKNNLNYSTQKFSSKIEEIIKNANHKKGNTINCSRNVDGKMIHGLFGAKTGCSSFKPINFKQNFNFRSNFRNEKYCKKKSK